MLLSATEVMAYSQGSRPISEETVSMWLSADSTEGGGKVDFFILVRNSKDPNWYQVGKTTHRWETRSENKKCWIWKIGKYPEIQMLIDSKERTITIFEETISLINSNIILIDNYGAEPLVTGIASLNLYVKRGESVPDEVLKRIELPVPSPRSQQDGI